MNIGIIGSGIGGLAAAHFAAKQGALQAKKICNSKK